MQRYHARFDGETPPIGLMWGTFDLRDARYNGVAVPTTTRTSRQLTLRRRPAACPRDPEKPR
ncbi:DUF5996 family protein [Coxiella burnetii]|uniref:DUF5996 family protein n=1 Tax=Coxiella burnetii TaxID=777 RepID=UPI0000DADEAE|nr:DUF5996 family protein [Coxiella burnetii]EDR35858.1 hypothetical protein COXBURSA334_0793 [Coxiella burnetii Q321]OYK80350.1 hypothetical protein CbuD7E6568_04410 [Coxiella burnetii]OYK82470.1 hypothetical protein CbuD7D7780_04430 [Coxiella burnetii]PHH58262.1 hypothetical protein CRH12_00395 [Coxiella burnetii]